MWYDAFVVAAKDLRIELRSRIGVSQVLPFGFVVLMLLAFGLSPDPRLQEQVGPGLFWAAVCFAAVLLAQRSVGLELRRGSLDAMRMSGLDPGGLFVGKAAAVSLQLMVLEAALGVGMVVLYGVSLSDIGEVIAAGVLGAAGLGAAGVLYATMAATLGARETLIPLLLLPVLAPVVLAAAQVWAVAGGIEPGGHPWLALLGAFVVVYVAAGVVCYGALLEAN
jgi:heme exporter protein B